MKICKNCGKQNENNNIYCSLKCRNIYVNKNLRDYSKMSAIFERKKKLRIKKYLENPKYCLQCGKKLSFEKRNGKFCDRSCSASYTNQRRVVSEETKRKVSRALKGKRKSKEIIKICEFCKNNFSTYRKIQKCCSASCRERNKHKNRNTKKIYRRLAQFNFALNNYMNEFNFDLIRENGWYKAKNHGNNLNGVSRDHLMSIDYGFKNKINPLLLAHPANCQLLKQKDNSSKYIKNDINLTELLQKINNWDEKYKGFYKPKLKTYISENDIKTNNLTK